MDVKVAAALRARQRRADAERFNRLGDAVTTVKRGLHRQRAHGGGDVDA